ncbi:undecaprenyl-diphosphate phosphatase, partial [Bacillus licheniformis]
QALALIPGVSRSGATTTAGLALGYTRPAAAEVAFLLAVPAVFGSGLYELVQAIREPGESPFTLVETGVATVVSFGVGLAVIAYLMRYLKRGSFLPFVLYRVVLGVVLLILLAAGVLQAY